MLKHFVVAVSGMDSNQAANAYLAGLNVWNYEMSLDTINALTCEDEGNIATQTGMSIYGSIGFTYDESFDCGRMNTGFFFTFKASSNFE